MCKYKSALKSAKEHHHNRRWNEYKRKSNKKKIFLKKKRTRRIVVGSQLRRRSCVCLRQNRVWRIGNVHIIHTQLCYIYTMSSCGVSCYYQHFVRYTRRRRFKPMKNLMTTLRPTMTHTRPVIDTLSGSYRTRMSEIVYNLFVRRTEWLITALRDASRRQSNDCSKREPGF